MGFTFTQKKKTDSEKNSADPVSSSGNESALPNSAQLSELGHQVGMPDVMPEKMEGAFGMDLSG